MRRSRGLRVTRVLGLALLLISSTEAARAGQLLPDESTLQLTLGGLPRITVVAEPTALVQLGDLPTGHPNAPGHFVGMSNSVWSTVNFGPGTSLFTGVPLISNLLLSARNDAGLLQSGLTVASNVIGGGGTVGPAFGGQLRLSGQVVIVSLGGSVRLPVPLSHVGGATGETTMVTLIGNNITATNLPFLTAPLVITGVTSNLITIPARANVQGVGFSLQPTPNETVMTLSTNGGFVSVSGGLALENHTVTVSGTNNLISGSRSGAVTVVAPMRVATGVIAGTIPAEVRLQMRFAPEPGTLLLLLAGAISLALVGRDRGRKDD